MEKEKKTFLVRIKNKIVNNYFNLTLAFMSVYMVISIVVVEGIHYLSKGSFGYGDPQSTMLVMFITLMMTMATMVKKLKDDIVSNYWKLNKGKKSKPKRRL